MFLVTDVQEATGREIVIATAGDQDTDQVVGAAVMMTGALEGAVVVAGDAIETFSSLFGYIGFVRQIFLM